MSSRRLQGKEWYDYRKNHKLTLLCISESTNGNYRADVLDECGNHFWHWLHPVEVKNLESSSWLNNHVIYDTNELYKSNLLKDLIKDREEKKK